MLGLNTEVAVLHRCLVVTTLIADSELAWNHAEEGVALMIIKWGGYVILLNRLWCHLKISTHHCHSVAMLMISHFKPQ